jgi:hypothetical protein
MKRYFYFVARFIKQGIEGIRPGIQEVDNGCFDFVDAATKVSEQENVDVKRVVITFWAETNSVMMGKFNSVK